MVVGFGIYANFEQVGFLDVLPSCETKENDPAYILGHKVACLYVSRKPTSPDDPKFGKKKAKRFTSLKRLQMNVRGSKPKFSDVELVGECDPETIDFAAEEFIEVCKKQIDDASKTVKMADKTNDHFLIDELQRAEDELMAGGKREKVFYRCFENMTKGIQNKNDTTKPPLTDCCEKLNKKLKALNPTDIQRGKEIADKIYTERHAPKCLVYFPKIFKTDFIHFIYKNKGERHDAANWRPITISPSFGKHLERVFTCVIGNIDDKNYDNHAYRTRRSCLTAIISVQKKLIEARLKGRE